MNVLITGGEGQLAADLRAVFSEYRILAVGRESLDLTQPETIARVFATFEPNLVLNTAAYNTVDRAESEPQMALAVNAAGPHLLAAACARQGAGLVHYSTDYVFNGDATEPYREDDSVDPINLYGVSKAAGEMAVRCTLENHLIIRTTGLFGLAGIAGAHGNFVETMLRLGTTREVTSVVADAVLTPTSTSVLARYTRLLIDSGARGTVHVTNSGQCSWYEFAAAIFRLAGLPGEVRPVASADYPTAARRPRYSVLAHDTIRSLDLSEPEHWHEALTWYLEQRPAALKHGENG
jgi:dTDP-4-dehydrorhamnose reductase